MVLHGPPTSSRVRKDVQVYPLYRASHGWRFLQVERKKKDGNLLYRGVWNRDYFRVYWLPCSGRDHPSMGHYWPLTPTV